MKPKLLFIAFAAIALCACVKEAEYADEGGSGKKQDKIFGISSATVPGWIRIKLKEEAAPIAACSFTRGKCATGNARLDAVAARLGATEIRPVFNDGGKFAERRRRYGMHLWYDFRIDQTVPVSRAAAEMASVEEVEAVEPIYKSRLAAREAAADFSDRLYMPVGAPVADEEAPFDDPELGKQWNYHNTGTVRLSVAGADINMFKAWREFGAGNREVIVAVIDGGIQYDHPDLAANMWTNEAELNGEPGVDDDGNGYIDDIYGWNFYLESPTIVPHYHGTHVAGILAAENNNGIGVCGVAGGTGAGDGIRMISCQTYSTNELGENVGYDDPDALAYAADMGAVIAQNSWGFGDEAAPPSMKTAIRYFINEAGCDENGVQTGPMKGGVVCFSAGNEGHAYVDEPSNMPEVVAVTAMGPDYDKASYSNYGSGADIMAPGGEYSSDDSHESEVYSTYTDSGYGYMVGTSMACPQVSGVAALIVSNYGVGHPGFTAKECKDILLRSYRPVGEYVWDKVIDSMGVGLLDASLIALKDPHVPPAKVENFKVTPAAESLGVSALVPGDGNGAPVLKIYLEYRPIEEGAFTGKKVTNVYNNTFPAGRMFGVVLRLPEEKSYEVGLWTEDRFGNCSERVSDVATTLPHANRPPRCKPIDDLSFIKPSRLYQQVIELMEYFSDPDISYYGDELTFSFESSDPEIVEVSLRETSLVMVAMYKGETTITVTATDKAGERASCSFTVVVMKGDLPPREPPAVEPPVVDPAARRGLTIYPNPVEDQLHVSVPDADDTQVAIAIYDAGARKVVGRSVKLDMDSKGIIDVKGLSAGVYTMVVNTGKERMKATFLKK